VQRQPTLASSCAVAATTAEARYRISYPDTARRNSRVIALDGEAAAVVRRLAGQHWNGGHFLIFGSVAPPNGSGLDAADAGLRRPDGTEVLLSAELSDADLVVMLAGVDASDEAASIIGDACAVRSIMSVGLVIPAGLVAPGGGAPGGGAAGGGAPGEGADEVVSALRPNAMVLVILQDANDIPEILSALRV
jgi:hypothetical protein